MLFAVCSMQYAVCSLPSMFYSWSHYMKKGLCCLLSAVGRVPVHHPAATAFLSFLFAIPSPYNRRKCRLVVVEVGGERTPRRVDSLLLEPSLLYCSLFLFYYRVSSPNTLLLIPPTRIIQHILYRIIQHTL
jgi:hypothetical protein